ncbi:cupin domain-containing protein [Streptomyces sp. ITFR-6]|uniref:cupin domain-containing protein n=1 Tax=Streptomyces sp. ITFR-6 TaxID=3075197 RepID=UPI00288A92CB|nr:cupin domain-containing protein [Streptomyces sp. ITFR-6]WNI28256.1 cupin domain-containing protein [Streptomyces sp. ITFR-6]
MTETSTEIQDEDTARGELVAALREAGIAIHQPTDPPLFTRTPEPAMVPMHWRWDDLEEFLKRLGEVVALSPGSARRTLRLANPGLQYGTTPTFWASIQYILPGEVATAHRHTASAFRFVMQGTGCSTTVEGENYEMNEGDLVLTPNWSWHDHVHEGPEPMIWLDVLDVSLMRSLENVFFDPYETDTQPVGPEPEKSWREYGSGLLRPVGPAPRRTTNPLLVYANEQTLGALERAKGLVADPADDVILEYQDPTSGGPVLPAMSMKAQILRAGFDGVAHRHSGSKVYWVVEGAGTMYVDGQRFDWGKGDFLAVPPWATVRHSNPHGSDARLFRVDDSAVLRALNVYHEEVDGDGATAKAER